MKKLPNRAFSLWELLLAIAILAFVLSAMLLLFLNCIVLSRVNRNTSLAYSAFSAKMEEIKGASFASLYVSGSCPDPQPAGAFCDGDIFDLDGFPSGEGKGKILIASEGGATNLKRIRIKGCFKSSSHGWIDGCDINNSGTWADKLVTLIAQ